MKDNDTRVNRKIEAKCFFCSMIRVDNRALYDGRTTRGPWAYMCEEHFRSNGVGLGLGKGQRIWWED